jgi:hypothetical protein
LNQDFNSLDAQREAGEGWMLLTDQMFVVLNCWVARAISRQLAPQIGLMHTGCA